MLVNFPFFLCSLHSPLQCLLPHWPLTPSESLKTLTSCCSGVFPHGLSLFNTIGCRKGMTNHQTRYTLRSNSKILISLVVRNTSHLPPVTSATGGFDIKMLLMVSEMCGLYFDFLLRSRLPVVQLSQIDIDTPARLFNVNEWNVSTTIGCVADFSSSATMRLAFVVLSEIYRRLWDNLPWNLVQTFMFPFSGPFTVSIAPPSGQCFHVYNTLVNDQIPAKWMAVTSASGVLCV